MRKPAPHVSLRSSGVTNMALWYELLGVLEVVRVVVGGVSVQQECGTSRSFNAVAIAFFRFLHDVS